MPKYSEDIQSNGFAVVPSVLDSATVTHLIDQLAVILPSEATKQRGQSYFGIRNLLDVAPVIRELAHSPRIRNVVEQVAGAQPQVVRGIFFDKTPQANWKVAWHQDLTIAVRNKRELPEFKCWSLKAGTIHVQPPAFVLEKMLTLRLHLDDAAEATGALKVLPGSHKHGRLSASDISRIKLQTKAVSCSVKRGDALVMRPLLLHSSSVAVAQLHRRVIHLEFSSTILPGGLEWYRS